jgi:hypothetical protein
MPNKRNQERFKRSVVSEDIKAEIVAGSLLYAAALAQ